MERNIWKNKEYRSRQTLEDAYKKLMKNIVQKPLIRKIQEEIIIKNL